jgi:hypothetical protein
MNRANVPGFVYLWRLKRWAGRFFRPRRADFIVESTPKRILALGVYLCDRKNTSPGVVQELRKSSVHNVTQRWARIGIRKGAALVEAVTVMSSPAPIPKFKILNQMLKEVSMRDFDVLLVLDDDIVLPRGFIDAFIAAQQQCDFSLCQPARTHTSWIDHRMVEQEDGLMGRQTRFVEIGPVFSIRSDLFDTLLPFDERSPMGWGLDFVWPILVEGRGLKMGIIDAVPVDHSLRKPVQSYSFRQAVQEEAEFLSTCAHLSREQAFTTLRKYPL